MRVAALMLFLTVVVSTAFADAPKVNLNAQNITLQDVAAQLTEQSGIQIVLDAEVTGSVSATLNGVDLEQVLDLITKPSNLVWQKLYAKPDETGKISMERIKAQVNALKALKDDPLVVFDPATGKQTVFARMENKAAEEIINPKELGLTPFYRIYKPETAVDPVTSSEPVTSKEFSDLSRKQLEMYAKMSPEEQRAAAEAEMIWMMSLPQESRVQMLSGMFGAMRNMDTYTRDQFRQTMREAFRNIRREGGDSFGGRQRRDR